MHNIIDTIIGFFRIYLFIKVGYLLTMCYFYPDQYNVLDLRWYMYFFIFDAWVMRVQEKYHKVDNNNDEVKTEN